MVQGQDEQPTTSPDKVLVLHSGGLDSSLALYQALTQGYEVLALFFCYGQKNIREYSASTDVVKYYIERRYPVRRIVLDIGDVFIGMQSELSADVEELSHWTEEQVAAFNRRKQGEASTSVPFRNGVFISIATAQALIYGCSQVWISSTGQGDTQYADCSSDFLDGMRRAVRVGSDGKVKLHTPFAGLSKEEIVTIISGDYDFMIDIPLELTWTCYGSGPAHCGTCLACVERKAAFRKVQFKDRIEYVA